MLNSLSKKVAGLNPCNFIKKRLQDIRFPVTIAKFLRTPILKNICDRLLLNLSSQSLLIIIYYKINHINIKLKIIPGMIFKHLMSEKGLTKNLLTYSKAKFA